MYKIIFCLELKPDRRTEIANDPQLPKQIFSLCFIAFCDLYWDCKKCLAKYHDATYLNDIVNENQHELCGYLKSKIKQPMKYSVSSFERCVIKFFNQKLLINVLLMKKLFAEISHGEDFKIIFIHL